MVWRVEQPERARCEWRGQTGTEVGQHQYGAVLLILLRLEDETRRWFFKHELEPD